MFVVDGIKVNGKILCLFYSRCQIHDLKISKVKRNSEGENVNLRAYDIWLIMMAVML